MIKPDENVSEEHHEAAEVGADVVGHGEEELLGGEVDEHWRVEDYTRKKLGVLLVYLIKNWNKDLSL